MGRVRRFRFCHTREENSPVSLVEHIAEASPVRTTGRAGPPPPPAPSGGGVQEEGLLAEDELVKAQGDARPCRRPLSSLAA